MSEVKFELEHGMKLGDERLKTVTLRELNSADIFEASEAAEKLVTIGQGKDASAEFVISPTLMTKETLRRQVVSIGTVKGPISIAELQSLHPEDLNLIEKYTQVLEGTLAPKDVARRGRSDTA